MANPQTPGDATDNAKTDASNTADSQKAGAEKDAGDTKDKAESDAADSANNVAKGGNVKDAAKDLAAKELEQAKAKAEQRKEEAKQAAIAMAMKNADIAKQMAIAAAMGMAQEQLGSLMNSVPGMDSPGGLGQKGPDPASNDLKNDPQKLTDIKPSEPSV
ncbi:MAG: hypothetical protein JWO03_3734 [Bacteroidetes bacterium]|nr:hypothetical protein [Bacteroidota bacterium]